MLKVKLNKARRRKLVIHSYDYYENEDTFEDVRAELSTTSFNLVCSVFGSMFVNNWLLM